MQRYGNEADDVARGLRDPDMRGSVSKNTASAGRYSLISQDTTWTPPASTEGS